MALAIGSERLLATVVLAPAAKTEFVIKLPRKTGIDMTLASARAALRGRRRQCAGGAIGMGDTRGPSAPDAAANMDPAIEPGYLPCAS